MIVSRAGPAAVALAAIGLAAWLGSLVGSGALSEDARVQAAPADDPEFALASFGTPEIRGHPGAATGLEWSDVLRQVFLIDRVN